MSGIEFISVGCRCVCGGVLLNSTAGAITSVETTGLSAGQSAMLDAATGSITIIPEPSTCTSLLAGLGCGRVSMWRR